ncbi:TetR/AcrR family transcriptional regulator [Archangium violaceum]|uniref:TetR/AcrR family transcriptional regulator n=1 Tax=Archangium violaceum TaxID=83451 RepID=UPI00193B7489|nr:TetR/AcrR family transcriptional regulator [Archangium violaceum]QRK07207.1 TetR/AcrR family transcriptional regulator [Archangium violaceum]
MTKRMTREESRQQTRQRLLEAAARVFAERGFHATSVDQVAEAAGYTKGAVYANFSSKDELFLALLEQRSLRDVESWTSPDGGLLSLEDVLRGHEALLHAQPDEEATRWGLLTLEFYLYAMREPQARKQLARLYASVRERLKTLLAAHYEEQGQRPALRVDQLAWAVFGLSSGLSIQASLEPEAVPKELFRDVMRQILATSTDAVGTTPRAPRSAPSRKRR